MKFFLLSIVLLTGFVKGYSTHIKGGEIYTESQSSSGNSFKIVLIIYSDDHSPVPAGGGNVNFGDGTGEYTLTDVAESKSTEQLQDGITKQTFIIYHSYLTSGTYLFYFREFNRNPNSVNIQNSVNTPFYLESKIVIDPFLGPNKSPELAASPNLIATVGTKYIDNPLANDADGDSLAFKLATPLQDLGVEVEGYQFPHHILDQNGAAANEAGTGKPIFSIDVSTGVLIWDAPVLAGQYIIAYYIEEWRKKEGEWYQIGYTLRDFHVTVEDVDNQRPYLIIPDNVYIKGGEILSATIKGRDPDGDPITIETSGAPYNFATLTAEYTQQNNEVHFSWQTDTEQISNQPYEVVFRIFDQPENGPVLYDYKIWKINVTTIASIADDHEKVILKIFPNPSSGIITVYSNYSGTDPVRITIFDLAGNLITEKKLTHFSNIDFDLRYKAKGIYILKFQGEMINQSKKLILMD